MKTVRVIPRLDIKGPNLVKGIHLEGLRVLGKPSDFAKYYYEQGADEILFMDVVASLYERNSLHDIITETAKSLFIPLTVGGGLRTIDDIKQVLRAGADKIVLNTAAIKDPLFIKKAASIFGSSTIVIAIEAIKQPDGKYLAYTDNAREYTGIDAIDWAKKVEELGAGEVLITCVDKEGTGKGYDIELIQAIAKNASIPVIAHGGAGCKEDILDVFKNTDIDALAIASILHYEFLEHSSSTVNINEGNSEFLKQKRGFSSIKPSGLKEIKELMNQNNISCRLV
jgi:imidazole glycerol-phosphate synthase subunit HisF